MVELKSERNKGGDKMGVPFKITISAARTNVGLSQAELAAKVGVDRTTVINWEKGKYIPSLTNLRKISTITGIPIDYIFLPETLPKVERKDKGVRK